MFSEIVLHDLRRPLAKRHAARRYCGPYRWTPARPGKGRGFYQAMHGLECDRAGSSFDLRLCEANDFLPGERVLAYYADEGGDTTLKPIVARLPRGRGFLAGWTMGGGMLASLDATVWSEPEDAAREAHRVANRDAEQSRDESPLDWDDEALAA